tara:strand:- start:320 stop:589 length:270 start_codon:yes stop_codon:yes gene_type:complete
MAYTQNPGRGPINKYEALQQKGLIGDKIKNKIKVAKQKRDDRRASRTKSENLRTDLASLSASIVGGGIVKFVKDALSGKPISGIFADKP